MRGTWGLVAASVVLVTAGVVVQGAELAWKTLSVRVYDNADVPRAALRVALEVAAQTLRPADLEVTWVSCSASSGGRCMVPLGRGELVVRLVRSPKQVADGADASLGTAMVDPATGTGVLATVFVDRVERLARTSDGDVGTLLGRAMAHEIGHLLMGRSEHAGVGLMRPRWTRAEVARNAKTDWRFNRTDVEAIRSRRVRF
jgi:hypothetical protein